MFGNSSISMIIIITSILKEFEQKTNFFEGCTWLMFNNFRLELGMTLTFYSSVVKRFKQWVTEFWGLMLTFVETNYEKLVEGPFCTPILNRVKKVSWKPNISTKEERVSLNICWWKSTYRILHKAYPQKEKNDVHSPEACASLFHT